MSGNSLEAHWRFSGVLALPWRPRLAAAGSTTHVIDPERRLVVEHIERWKSEPGEVVARLLRPAAKVPTTPWEVFMHGLSKRDAKLCWYVVSRRATLLAAPVVAAAAACHAATGACALPHGAAELACLAACLPKTCACSNRVQGWSAAAAPAALLSLCCRGCWCGRAATDTYDEQATCCQACWAVVSRRCLLGACW